MRLTRKNVRDQRKYIRSMKADVLSGYRPKESPKESYTCWRGYAKKYKQYKIAALAGKALFGHPKYDTVEPEEKTEPHTPVDYQVGIGYCLESDMNVRNRAGATDKASIVGVLKKGTWVQCQGLITIEGKIWMLIPPDPSGKSNTQFVCADNGKTSYIK